MNNWNNILKDFAHKCGDGGPDMTNPRHLALLRESLIKFGWKENATNEFIGNLREGEKKYADNTKNRALGRVGLPWGSKGTPPEKEEPKGEEGGEDDKKGEEESGGGSTSENIDAIDGEAKEGGMNGTVTAPGNATSTVNEIGVGYAMACMEEEPDNVEGCLDRKLDSTTLGAKANKKKRKQILQSARAEKKRVDDHIEEKGMNPETTSVSHVWGSKASLAAAAKKLEELRDGEPPVTHINGIPIDEYIEIVLGGGGGGDPTDTMVILEDESQDPPRVEILHTSNKTTSADIQANGSPHEEIDQISQSARDQVESEEDKAAVDEADRIAKEKVEDARERQKDYIGKQGTKMSKQAQDDATADRMLGRLENDENDDPPGISSSKGKYYKKVLGHPAVKAWMKGPPEKKPPLTPEEKREMLRAYAKGVSDPNDPNYKLRNDDIRILAEFYKDEELTTGRDPEKPIYNEEKMKSFYEEQTDAMNEQRETLNNIKPGMGDELYTDRMLERLHIPAPDVPPNFQLNMGEYAYKDLQQDKDGNLYEKGADGKWYKIDENGNREENASDIDTNDLSDTECAVIVDEKAHRHCLGLKEGEDIKSGITVRYTEIKGEDGNYKAIIYDNQDPPNVIAIQTCRSKSGPGGSVNDTIHYGKDYQRCLAKHTIQNDRCG